MSLDTIKKKLACKAPHSDADVACILSSLAYYNDVDTIRQVMHNKGITKQWMGAHDWAPLFVAVRNGNQATVAYFLDMISKDEDDDTLVNVFIEAIKSGNVACVDTVFNHQGRQITLQERGVAYAVRVAIATNDEPMLDKLIDLGLFNIDVPLIHDLGLLTALMDYGMWEIVFRIFAA